MKNDVDVGELVAEVIRKNLKARAVFHATMRAIIEVNHLFWARVGIEWRSSSAEHIKTCDVCQELFIEAIRQLYAEQAKMEAR